MNAVADALLTKQEVAAMLRVSVRTIERLVARKQLTCVAIGSRCKRFRMTEVERAKSRFAGDAKPGAWI